MEFRRSDRKAQMSGTWDEKRRQQVNEDRADTRDLKEKEVTT